MKVSNIALILFGLLVGVVVPTIYSIPAGIIAFGILIAYGLFICFSTDSFIIFSKAWFSTTREIDNIISTGSKGKVNRYLTLFPLSVIGGLVAHFFWPTL